MESGTTTGGGSPFGGWKQIGVGHEAGLEGLEDHLETKRVSIGGF